MPTKMILKFVFLSAVSLLLVVVSAKAQTNIQYPKPTGFINDYAHILSTNQLNQLTTMVSDFEKRKTIEIGVAIMNTILPATDINVYATTLFNQWGIGKQGMNNGILFLVALEDRKIRIEIGLGLKKAMTRESLNAKHSVFEEITGGVDTLELGGRSMNSRSYCNRFGFKGTDQQKIVGSLSGGERNRVHLAKLLRAGGNLILLDEPTNDLDVNTLRALEEGLTSFGGCAVVISHDRWFLDRVATHILAFEGDSTVDWFEGNYQAFHEHRRALLGDAADRPQRIRFRPVRHQ